MSFNYGKRFVFLAVFAALLGAQTITAQIITRHSETPASRLHSNAAKMQATRLRSVAAAFDETIEVDFEPKAKDIKYQFRRVETKKRNIDFDGDVKTLEVDVKTYDADEFSLKQAAENEPRYVRETAVGRGFNYRGAFTQSLIFLAVQHGYATTQPKTREALKHGAFWRDYADSVKALHGWDDGGRFFTNYLAHPMQGAFTGHIYVQNSPQALREQFSMSPKYWQTRMKALLWTTAWSTQFELGPISQASIGNVGLKGKQTWEDIVVTPTLGTAMLIGEDAIDQYAIKYIERRNSNLYVKIFARMLLNPTRNFSNMLRFREPWYRDRAVAR